MPPARSRNTLPSTSSTTAPSARAGKTGVEWNTPRGTASTRLCITSWDLGPGTEVRIRIVAILAPPDRWFVQIDVNLLRLEIFLDPPRTEFSPEAGLLKATPRCFDIRRLHVVDPHY